MKAHTGRVKAIAVLPSHVLSVTTMGHFVVWSRQGRALAPLQAMDGGVRVTCLAAVAPGKKAEKRAREERAADRKKGKTAATNGQPKEQTWADKCRELRKR